jgi:hypothetical protein
MHKFNNGNGAMICDVCRIIIKSPISPEDSKMFEDTLGRHYCSDHTPKDQFYSQIRATEEEHIVIEDAINEFCMQNPDVKLLYYRKLKKGHVPMYRELKVQGCVYKFLNFLYDTDIALLRREDYQLG